MVQMNENGRWQPTKIFPCSCGSEGVIVTLEEDEIFSECLYAPYINMAFWNYAGAGKLGGGDKLSIWERIKYSWRILKGGSPWADMVGMEASTARNFANHILYLLNKAKKTAKQEKVLVEWPEKGERCPLQ